MTTRLDEIEARIQRPAFVVYVYAPQSTVDDVNRIVQERSWLAARLRQAEAALAAVEKWHAPDCPYRSPETAPRPIPGQWSGACECPHGAVVRAICAIREEATR